jgi:antitoxin component YwqK of YwqJK toxin-antitoxin module
MKIVIILFFALFIISGCDTNQKPPQNGLVRKPTGMKEFPIDDHYEYSGGNLVRFTRFFANGKIYATTLSTDSGIHRTEWFYESGKPCGVSIENTKPVSQTVWDENGNTLYEFKSETGHKRKGIWYYLNGETMEIAEFMNDQRHGKWFQWDSLGFQTRKEWYANGVLIKKIK